MLQLSSEATFGAINALYRAGSDLAGPRGVVTPKDRSETRLRDREIDKFAKPFVS